MDKAFRNAAFPKACRIMGFNLKPMTLGHVFLLRQFDCVLLDNQEPTLGELLLSCFICSDTWKNSASNITKWWVPIIFKLVGWKCRRLNLSDEIDSFFVYLKDSFAMPTFNRDSKSMPKELGAPFEYVLLVTLMTQLGMSMSDALSCQLTFANCLELTLADMKGSVFLETDSQRAFYDFARNNRVTN